MTRTKQLQNQHQLHHQHHQLHLLLLLFGLLQVLPAIAALPQQPLLLEASPSEQATTATAPALNDPSDLSAGLNLLPVSNWIAAAANVEPPAPVQFIRIAMNSGL
ncbi:uncharacterized protein LOC111591901 [Drosophila hydei]|uniref:Uncharacterized protein LOC111591901 n=1 Tax=Drosophila hydei TaxID=7224 RepID=A0A6J1L664_DROHY|nr:uncharacterized protein LOC111591901 [Drosophila hydei]